MYQDFYYNVRDWLMSNIYKVNNKIGVIGHIQQNKMISTKGFYYFNHENPEHNIKTRKNKLSRDFANIQNQKLHLAKQPSENITGIEGKSYNHRFSDQGRKYIFNRFNRKNDGKLTFQKLQHILNATSSIKQPKSKSRVLVAPEAEEVMQFYRKNSFYVSPSSRYFTQKKTPKNKQLKQYIFKSEKRSATSFSRTFQKSQVSEQLAVTQNSGIKQEQGIAIFPTMSGVFIPSAKYKYSKHKKKFSEVQGEKQRHKTFHNS